jgi:hypothetical protein
MVGEAWSKQFMDGGVLMTGQKEIFSLMILVRV